MLGWMDLSLYGDWSILCHLSSCMVTVMLVCVVFAYYPYVDDDSGWTACVWFAALYLWFCVYISSSIQVRKFSCSIEFRWMDLIGCASVLPGLVLFRSGPLVPGEKPGLKEGPFSPGWYYQPGLKDEPFSPGFVLPVGKPGLNEFPNREYSLFLY